MVKKVPLAFPPFLIHCSHSIAAAVMCHRTGASPACPGGSANTNGAETAVELTSSCPSGTAKPGVAIAATDVAACFIMLLPSLLLLLVLAAVTVAAGIACSSAAGVACFRCNRSCFILWGDSSPISLRSMFVAVSIASGVICEAPPALPAPTPQGPQVNGHTGGGVPGLGTASFGIGGG